jgi:hypothetical protein
LLVQQTVYADTTEIVDIEFSHPLKIEELQPWLTQHNVVTSEINFSHGEIQGGLEIDPNDSLGDSFVKLQAKHAEFLSVAISSIDEDLLKTNDKLGKKRLTELRKQLVLSQEINKKEQEIDGVRISVSSPSITENIESDPLIAQVRRLKKESGGDSLALAATTYYVSPKLWYPTKGSTKTTKSLAFNTFYFANASGFDSFSGILTYEHETQVYNSSFANYGGYWSSNLPKAYKDTQFLDSLDNFTVGSSKASDIVANTQYYTSMDLSGGTASSATVRIKGQLGYRYPSTCYSTWCIFAIMTTPTLKMYTAPISTQVSWTYTP